MPGGMVPRAGGQGSHAAAMTKARLLGRGPAPKGMTDEDRQRLNAKRKKERQNKKNARRHR